MDKNQYLRLISIFGALVVGAWMPLRWIGLTPTLLTESLFFILLGSLFATNIYLYFDENKLSVKDLKSWLKTAPILDFLSLSPVLLLSFRENEMLYNAATVFCLLAARHIFSIKKFLDQFSALHPMAYRLTPVFTTMPLLVHLIACTWMALGSGSAQLSESFLFNYIQSYYWAVTTLTTVGYGDIVPVTALQMLFACFTQVIGVGVFGYVLSNVAGLLARYDAARENHMDNLDQAETFMKIHKTPFKLKNQVRNYYQHTWLSKKGYQDQTLLENLPAKLQSDLLLHINKSIIEKVPFFRGADQELLTSIMGRLQFRILVPGEVVFKVNDPGDNLYFIQSGEVEIFTAKKQHLATLSDGSFFGEMALISHSPRTATVVASSYCNMYYLSREAFDEVANSYPSFRQYIEEVMRTRKTA